MTTTAQVRLNPYESAALTRLVMAFCLGKGSICLYSRSYVLQIGQPLRCGDYSRYQWRRLCQFIPSAKEPALYALDGNEPAQASKGQWRLRVSSRWFETAYNMLYPLSGMDDTGFRPFRIEPPTLELLGAEAIAALWADRGRLLVGGKRLRGQMNLSRVSFEEAELVRDWISRLTGCHAEIDHSPRNGNAPMLFFDREAVLGLLQALRPTWMAQASCLASKFQPSEELKLPPAAPSRRRITPRPPGKKRPLPPRPDIPPLLRSAA